MTLLHNTPPAPHEGTKNISNHFFSKVTPNRTHLDKIVKVKNINTTLALKKQKSGKMTPLV